MPACMLAQVIKPPYLLLDAHCYYPCQSRTARTPLNRQRLRPSVVILAVSAATPLQTGKECSWSVQGTWSDFIFLILDTGVTNGGSIAVCVGMPCCEGAALGQLAPM